MNWSAALDAAPYAVMGASIALNFYLAHKLERAVGLIARYDAALEHATGLLVGIGFLPPAGRRSTDRSVEKPEK